MLSEFHFTANSNIQLKLFLLHNVAGKEPKRRACFCVHLSHFQIRMLSLINWWTAKLANALWHSTPCASVHWYQKHFHVLYLLQAEDYLHIMRCGGFLCGLDYNTKSSAEYHVVQCYVLLWISGMHSPQCFYRGFQGWESLWIIKQDIKKIQVTLFRGATSGYKYNVCFHLLWFIFLAISPFLSPLLLLSIIML